VDRQQIGRDAEERAARYLADAGLKLLTRNYRCRMGELDIVACSGGTLVVVEVRLRSRDDFGGAAASVTPAKCRRIVRATRHLLACSPHLARMPVRFDVLVVHPDNKPTEWLRGAFDAC
jgi:putative endonuclease